MTTSFPRIVGPKADVAELEYVAALHQTCAKKTRNTGTISSLDVMRFLKSRHSLEISHAQARDIVLALGGGQACQKVRVQLAETAAIKWREQQLRLLQKDQENLTHAQRWRLLSPRNATSLKRKKKEDSVEVAGGSSDPSSSGIEKTQLEEAERMLEEILSPKLLYMDIVQMTAVILIPTLARMAKQHQNSTSPPVPLEYSSLERLQHRFDHLMHNHQTGHSGDDNNHNDNAPKEGVPTSILNKNDKSGITEASDDEAYLWSLQPKPEGLIQLVLLSMLNMIRDKVPSVTQIDTENDISASGGVYYPRLTPQLVQTLLQEYGEMERANDPNLIQRMVDVAAADGGPLLMDEGALVRALTADLQDWDVGCEDRPTTYVYDVFGNSTLQTFDRVGNGFHIGKQMKNLRMDSSLSSSRRQRQYDEGNFKSKTSSGNQREADKGQDAMELGCLQSDPVDESSGKTITEAICNPKGRSEDKSPDDVARLVKLLYSVVGTYSGSTIALDSSQQELSEEEDNIKSTSGNSNEADNERNAVEMGYEPFKRQQFETIEGSADKGKISNDDSPEDIVELASKNSARILDTVVDSFGSSVTLLLAWMTFIGQTGSYAALILQTEAFTVECKDQETFGCMLGRTVVSWVLVALLLVLFGFVVLVPLSHGNHPTKRGPARMLLSTFVTLTITIFPFVILKWYGREHINEVTEGVVQTAESEHFIGLIYLTTVLGLTLAMQYFFHFGIGVARNHGHVPEKGGWVDYFSVSSHIVGTTRSKRACTRKINALLTNARSMHGSAEALAEAASESEVVSMSLRKTESDAVFQNYTLRGESTSDVGSLLWVWERIITGALFDEEGIWLPARLIIFQFGQLAFAILIMFLLFIFVKKAADDADAAQGTLTDGLPDWVYAIVPTGDQVRWALLPAASVSVAVCFFLTLIYIPSTVKTVLKFRCGHFGALGAETFRLARRGPDSAYMNTANAIYGMVAAAGLFFFLIGLLLFLFIWDFSRQFVLLITAWGIGLGITIGLKVIMTSFCRKQFFRAFYRIHPGRANITTLALECWFIGLGGGVLIGRITQFLMASAFWIGRIDEPFLADNVSLFGYKFDYVPLNYVKEILVHEAHRHPYIERLGAMYLMRLRYKSFASSDACACWRQLFVLTLLPWLMKYRIFHEQRCIESIQDQKSEKEVEAEEDREPLAATAEDILGATMNLAGMVDQGARKVGQVGFDAVDAVGQVGVGAVDVVGQVGLDAVDVGAQLFKK